MLDQNTDRMWYVIGAVIIGAAIILILNGTAPELFASVGDTFKGKTDDVSAIVGKITPNVGNGVWRPDRDTLTDGVTPVSPNQNLFNINGMEIYEPYHTLVSRDDTSFELQYALDRAAYIAISIPGFVPGKQMYTLSGYLSVDGEIREKSPLGERATTYAAHKNDTFHYNPDTGYFEYTQLWPNNASNHNRWVFHTYTTAIEQGSIIRFDKVKLELGDKATPWLAY